MSGFGLAPIKEEGAPMHPDDMLGWTFPDHWTEADYSKWYDRQLKAYNDYHNIKDD